MNLRATSIILIVLGIGALITALWLSARDLHSFTDASCGSLFSPAEADEGDPFDDDPAIGCEGVRSDAAALPIAFGVMGGIAILAGILVVAVSHEERHAAGLRESS